MIQERYGWTDEIILDLPYARFIQIVETIGAAKTQQYEEQLKQQAHLGFQMAIIQGAKIDAFKDYLEGFGLGEKPTEISKEEAQAISKKLKDDFYDFVKDMKV